MRLKLDWPAWFLLGLTMAFWPVWRWYALRMTDGSDEPWGVVALVTLVLLRWGRQEERLMDRSFVLPAVLLAIYFVSYGALLPLGRAILAAGAFGAVLLRGRGMAGLWGLLTLSLPVMATLQFYLGFPLRLLAAEVSTQTLQILGYDVIREGTLLHWRGETILVDAPCSGVHMLWTGGYMAMLLAGIYRLGFSRTVLLGGAAVGIVVAANVIRATVLFFKEARIVAAPDWTHSGTGILLFVGGAWLILTLADRLQPKPLACPSPCLP